MSYTGDKLFMGYEPGLTEKYRALYGGKNKDHLTKDDMACPCCGISLVKKEFLDKINRLIDDYGDSVKVSKGGGYRCPKYNAEIGGSKNSAHVDGSGIDILEKSARVKRKLAEIAFKLGFVGVGIYDLHIHIDDKSRWHNKNVIWSGRSK